MNYIDYDIAIRYTSSEVILNNVIKRFVNQYENLDLKLLDLSKEEVLFIVHKIKGVTLNIGAKKLYDECITLEESNDYESQIKLFIYVFNKSYKELLNH